MEKELGIICAEGLSFFGKNNRFVSHELKNILAIISETLGLIDELMELSETGTVLEPGKLRSLSESVMEEVERANMIIRNMNTFAHSVDGWVGEVDINQVLALMIKLTQLNPASRNTEIRLLKTDPHIVYTSPFFLETLIHHTINFVLLCAGPEKKIEVSIHPTKTGIRITFSGLNAIKGSFPTDNTEYLAKVISAEILIDTSAGGLHIELPQRMNEGLIQYLLPEG
ncbi:hypothetical protein ACFL9T_03395 [Thermodesulfobacteriota bacterium]